MVTIVFAKTPRYYSIL